MKLHEVIKRIAIEHGIEIVCQERLVNFVADYSPDAFQPPALKLILRYVISKGYAKQLVSYPSGSINQYICHFSSKLSSEAGYSAELTNYVLNSIAYGYGFAITFDERKEQRCRPIKVSKDIKPNKNVISYYGPTPKAAHLLFKGVEIYGYAKDFVEKMCENGFSIIKAECDEHNDMLKGSYSNIPCKLMVQKSPLTHRTSRVMVIYDDKVYKNWPALKALYFNLKDKLTIKYGDPTSSTEAFFPPHKDGDGNEIALLDVNLGAYQSIFNAEGGEVRLVIMSEARVIIAFMDTLGCNELNREFEQAAQDDM